MNATTKTPTKTTAKTPARQRRDEMLTVIAMKHLDLQSLNFSLPTIAKCPIPAIKAALEAAYEAGSQATLAALAR